MTAPTRRGPGAESPDLSKSAHQNATDTADRTTAPGPAAVVGIGSVDAIGTPLEAGRVRGTFGRLTGCPAVDALELLDRLGPAAATALALALLALAGEVVR